MPMAAAGGRHPGGISKVSASRWGQFPAFDTTSQKPGLLLGLPAPRLRHQPSTPPFRAPMGSVSNIAAPKTFAWEGADERNYPMYDSATALLTPASAPQALWPR